MGLRTALGVQHLHRKAVLGDGRMPLAPLCNRDLQGIGCGSGRGSRQHGGGNEHCEAMRPHCGKYAAVDGSSAALSPQATGAEFPRLRAFAPGAPSAMPEGAVNSLDLQQYFLYIPALRASHCEVRIASWRRLG
jgi:hypothetical protein